VLVDQFGHLEHVDLRLAAEDGLQRGVSLDHPPVLRVLQLVLLDVRPELLGDLGARNRLATTSASAALGVIAFMNAALGFLALFFFAVFFAFLAIWSPLVVWPVPPKLEA
jgi:hypothetical protein